MMKRFDKLRKLAIIALVCTSTVGCDKNEDSSSFDVFTCVVNGVVYKDYMPYLLPPGGVRTPYIKYRFDENGKRLIFFSRPILVQPDEESMGGHSIYINIPLEDPIEINKEYYFEESIPIEGDKPLFYYMGEYREKGLPYCLVISKDIVEGSEVFYVGFGAGKLSVTSIEKTTGGKDKWSGIIEFTLPNPKPKSETEILTFKGQFGNIMINDNQQNNE